jgi:hypothetical protein
MTIGIAMGVQAGMSLLGGIMGKRAAKEKARAQRAMAKYNADILRMNAKAQASQIEYQATKLSRSQRDLQAKQRMSVYARGGIATGTDMKSLLNQARLMQEDALELQRQADIATATGENKARGEIFSGEIGAQQARAEGRQAMFNGVMGAVGAYGTYKINTTSG